MSPDNVRSQAGYRLQSLLEPSLSGYPGLIYPSAVYPNETSNRNTDVSPYRWEFFIECFINAKPFSTRRIASTHRLLYVELMRLGTSFVLFLSLLMSLVVCQRLRASLVLVWKARRLSVVGATSWSFRLPPGTVACPARESTLLLTSVLPGASGCGRMPPPGRKNLILSRGLAASPLRCPGWEDSQPSSLPEVELADDSLVGISLPSSLPPSLACVDLSSSPPRHETSPNTIAIGGSRRFSSMEPPARLRPGDGFLIFISDIRLPEDFRSASLSILSRGNIPSVPAKE